MKKILIMFMSVCLLFVLMGCTKYEDTNGDDNYTLQTITDKNIIHLEVGASNISYKEQNLGGISSSEYSSNNYNGVSQLYLTDFLLPSDIEVYIGHMSVEKGNFRLVVINKDKIIRDIPIDSFNETFRFENLTGTFSIHVAGESAKFDFHMSVE